MARRIIFNGVEIGFPTACVVCQQPSQSDYKISKIFSYGNRTITVTLPVPMCPEHYAMAMHKGPAEQTVGRIGLGLGALFGLAAAIALLVYWSNTGQGSLVTNILLALVLAAGIFLIFWVLFAFWIAPLFAMPDQKAARNAVKIRRYWPSSQQLQLEFYNEQIANRVVQANQGLVARAD